MRPCLLTVYFPDGEHTTHFQEQAINHTDPAFASSFGHERARTSCGSLPSVPHSSLRTTLPTVTDRVTTVAAAPFTRRSQCGGPTSSATTWERVGERRVSSGHWTTGTKMACASWAVRGWRLTRLRGCPVWASARTGSSIAHCRGSTDCFLFPQCTVGHRGGPPKKLRAPSAAPLPTRGCPYSQRSGAS